MAQLDPYALRDEVDKLIASKQPGAEAAILQLLAAHGYDQPSWKALRDRMEKAEKIGGFDSLTAPFEKAWGHHQIQTEHGNRAREAAGKGGVLGHAADQMRVFNDALTFGIGDYVIGQLPGRTSKGERQETQTARNRLTPFERVTGTVAGAAVLPAPKVNQGLTAVQEAIAGGKSLGPRVVQGAKEGAKFGALDAAGHQLGNNDLSLGQQILQAGAGGLIGATAGGAIPVAGAATRWAASKIPGLRDYANRGLSKAQQIILKSLRDDAEARATQRGLPQPSARDAVTQARTRVGEGGPETMIGDLGPAGLATTQGAISKPGPGASATQMTIKERAAGEEGRMQALTDEVLPPTGEGTLIPSQANIKTQGEPTRSAESIIDEARTALQPQYTQVLNNPNIAPIAQGDVAAIVQRIDGELATLPQNSPHRASLERIRNNLVDQPAQPATPGTPGNAYTLPTPATPAVPETYVTDHNILHNLKGELQGRVNWEEGATTGAARKVEGANKVISGAIDNLLDTAVPGYAGLNDEYRRLTGLVDDISVGQRVLDKGTTAEELANAMGRGQGPVMSGAMETINNLLNNSRGKTFSQLTGMITDSAPGLAEKMRMILGDDGYARFMSELRAERARKETAQAVSGNPPTAQRRAAGEAMDEVANVPARASAEGWIAQILAMGVKAVDAFRSQEVRNRVAEITGLQGDALDRELGDMLARVQIQQQKAAIDLGRSGAAGASATQLPGLLGTPGITGVPEQVDSLTIDIDRRPPTP